ncbi:MAG: hypothetical protein LBD46_00010 [Endomicrobium sp.]|jgi:hypothetical protein|nr:hypothetical protein [Endomicrobium sp.]
MQIKNLLLLSLSIVAISVAPLFAQSIAGSTQTSNFGNNIYSLYSENFNGIKIDLHLWSGQTNNGTPTQTPNLNDIDRVRLIEWNGGTAGWGAVSERGDLEYSNNEEKVEGNKFFRVNFLQAVTNGWAGWGFIFKDGTTADNGYGNNTYRDMSAYANGKIEFWVRTSATSSQYFQVGFQTSSNGDKLVTLGSLSGFVMDGKWHKVSIDLTPYNSFLNNVKMPFIMTMSGANAYSAILDLDQIVWKKAGNAVSWDAKLMVVSTAVYQESSSSEITWTLTNAMPNGWKAADQYLELTLDCIPNDNWGIQIFSDTKAAYANPKYTGASTDTAFGLVNTDDTTKMIPLAWRVTDKVLPYTGTGNSSIGDYNQTLEIGFYSGGNISGIGTVNAGLYDSGSPAPNKEAYHPWFYLKDKSQYASDAALEAEDYIRVWDKRGFHASPDSYWGMSAGAMINFKIAPKLYLAADFSKAFAPATGSTTYKNNAIILRLFYE